MDVHQHKSPLITRFFKTVGSFSADSVHRADSLPSAPQIYFNMNPADFPDRILVILNEIRPFGFVKIVSTLKKLKNF